MYTTSTQPRPYVSQLSGMEVILNAEILKPGSVRDANGKSFNPTPKDFDSMLRAYKDGVIRRIPVKVGHTSDEYNLAIAKALKIPPLMVVGENNRGAVNLGQFTNLRPGAKGGLTADIEVPKAIHGLAKQQLIRNLSMEILHNVMVNGKFYPMVIKAGCLLGRENPAIPLSDFKLSERQGFGEFSTYTLSEFSIGKVTQLAGPTTGDVHQPSILKKRIRNRQGNREVQLENRRAIGLAPRRTKYTQTSGGGKKRSQGYIRKDIDRPIGALRKLLKGKIPKPLQILRAGEKYHNSELAERQKKSRLRRALPYAAIGTAGLLAGLVPGLFAARRAYQHRKWVSKGWGSKTARKVISIKTPGNRPSSEGLRAMRKYFERENLKVKGSIGSIITPSKLRRMEKMDVSDKKISELLSKYKLSSQLAAPAYSTYKVPVTTTSDRSPDKRVEVVHVKASDPSRAQTSALRLLERGLGRTFEIVGSAAGLILAVHLGKRYLIGKGTKTAGGITAGGFMRKLEAPTQLSVIVGRRKPGYKGPKPTFKQLKDALEDPKHGSAARGKPGYYRKQRQRRTHKRQGALYGAAAAGIGAGIGALRFAGRRKLESSMNQTQLALPAHKAIKAGQLIARRIGAGRTPKAVKWQMKKNEAKRQANLTRRKVNLSTYLAERMATQGKKKKVGFGGKVGRAAIGLPLGGVVGSAWASGAETKKGAAGRGAIVGGAGTAGYLALKNRKRIGGGLSKAGKAAKIALRLRR